MELYKLIATIKNHSISHLTDYNYTFEFIPENFEGVKIAQQFSFVNPIGYTPKFSIDTMRTIGNDKSTLDNIFLTYGLESNVIILIQKLNAIGTAYVNVSTFAIDFESYEIFNIYSEFALKSISVIDFYNNIKNTERQIELTADATFPNTQKFINYVSLKSWAFHGEQPQFKKTNESKIYNKDASLYSPFEIQQDAIIYSFGAGVPTSAITMYFSINFDLYFTGFTGILNLNLYKFDVVLEELILIQEIMVVNVGDSGTSVKLNPYTYKLNLGICNENDYLLLIDLGFPYNIKTTGNMFVDLKLITNLNIVNSDVENIKYVSITNVLKTIFNNNITSPDYDLALTSANQLLKLNDFANFKPKEFLSDFCLATGSILNFKIDGSVAIDSMLTYFNTLFAVEIIEDVEVKTNAITITDFKDVSIRYNTSLNFSSVSAGHEINTYDIYSYLIDWNKVLTFTQRGRNAVENLDLTLLKFRTDFSGMLDYFYKRSNQSQKTSKDNFIFDPSFRIINETDTSILLYDNFTPRNILTNWNKFLSFCFHNYSKNTLVISSNGGTHDNLGIARVKEMDNIVFNSTPRILPVEYELTCLINDVDFSKNILKINHQGEDVYLFVINAETMDTLSEQKIKGLKIQF